MNAYVCDRCGKVISPASDASFVTFLSDGMILKKSSRADLCIDCFQIVKKIAFGKAKPDLEGK